MQKVYYRVAAMGEIAPGTGKPIQVGEEDDYVLFCTADGEYYAATGLCPHQNEPMDRGHLEGREVICRRHHLRFDLRSGDCTNAGGYSLHVLEVKVENGDIFVGQWED